MPVVNTVIVAILPYDGDAIRPCSLDGFNTGFGVIPVREFENSVIRLALHIFVAASALRARAGCPQQREGVLALMAIRPLNGHL